MCEHGTNKYINNVGNDFTTEFSGVQNECIESAEASSQPPPDATLHAIALRGPTKPGMCAGCGLPVNNIHTCDVCKHNMHVFCGKPIGEEGHRQKIRCTPCQRALDAWASQNITTTYNVVICV